MSERGQYRRIGYVVFGEDFLNIDSVLQGFKTLDSHFRCDNVAEHLYEHVDDDFMYTITLV